MLVGSSEAIETDKAIHHRAMSNPSRVVIYYGTATDILTNLLTRVYRAVYGGSDINNNRSPSTNPLIVLLKHFERKIEKCLDSFNHSHAFKHSLCTHRYNCAINASMGFAQRYIAGYLIQIVVKCLGSLGSILRKPKLVVEILLNPVNRELGMFLGSYVLIFRAVSCLLKWLTNKNSKVHGMASGFFAGWSMMFYKSSSIALYLSFKLLEVIMKLLCETLVCQS
jgi:hypothetical protein